MNRSYLRRAVLIALALFVVSAGAAVAQNITNVVVIPRVFNDCPTSTFDFQVNYPSSVWMQESGLTCTGFANLHVWRLSEDNSTPAAFQNNVGFRIAADLMVTGEADGEAGMQITPWWATTSEGRFNVRTTDGEIAIFGGRLPFYSFTAQQGLTYTKGDVIHMEMVYQPNQLNSASPGTIEYRLRMNNQDYTSGPVAFDEGDPSEGQGSWGILDNAQVGGHLQTFLDSSGNAQDMIRADWTNIEFELLTQGEQGACCMANGQCVLYEEQECIEEHNGQWQGANTTCDPNPCELTPTEEKSWGQIKHEYSTK